jgi:hypothetical protein
MHLSRTPVLRAQTVGIPLDRNEDEVRRAVVKLGEEQLCKRRG